VICQCANCDWTGEDVRPIKHYSERVDPDDDAEPAGECPECGCLAYEVEPLSEHERAHFAGGVMPVDKRLHVK
jgi:hypothetical protein